MPIPTAPIPNGFSEIIQIFIQQYGAYLMGFFVCGLAFMVGRTISFSLLIAFPLFLMLAVWFESAVFLGLALVALVLGLILRQMGV